MTLPSESEIDFCYNKLNMVVISTVGRAGSMLLQSLFDSHPSIVVIPEVAQSYNYFDKFIELNYDIEEWLTTNSEFYNGFDPFNKNFNKKIDEFFISNRMEFINAFNSIGIKLGGVRSFDSKKFMTTLVFSLAHIYKKNIKKIDFFVFHHHNNKRISKEIDSMLQDFPTLKVLVAIRHPIENALSFQTLESRTGVSTFKKFSRNVRGWSVGSLRNFTRLINKVPINHFRLLDLNALHGNPEKIISRVAAWIGIENHSPLMKSSISSIPWLGNSADGKPIKTFEEKRKNLIYPYSIGSSKGLTQVEYQYAQYLCNDAMAKLGYSNILKTKPITLFNFLIILVGNIDFFDDRVIPHDKGFRKLIRKFGYSEILLIINQLILMKYAPIQSLIEYRIDMENYDKN
jgi:hypothetical protein